ncbi:methyl-accepting chemotaxis protein [Desulfovibrio psychrotolerans]|uniref:Methyl-accepting chemotaxis protein n=1 Tax=Desulfovibrio psychrotolerans TaxID=415242 RepID=A0A7J0BSY2_9BACT|nr:methyl-accepting chemotaxis protein [Desulfovibrio psychrotolerans]GFM36245.1 hypothetical protein DSM19430T_09290 [Desulfovibrio psychrotolerans]
MSIKAKLLSICLVAILGLSAIYLVNLFGARTVDRAILVNLAAQQSTIAMLQARRAEKDFLARKDPALIERFSGAVQESSRNLKVVAANQPVYAARAEEAVRYLERYKTSFMDVAATVQLLGLNENEGLSGTLRAAIHKVEEIIDRQDDDSLKADMLMLRRREKDFMLRGDVKYLERFTADAGKMLERLDVSDRYEYSLKQEMKALVLAYQESFGRYVEGAQRVEASLGELVGVIRTAEPMLETLAVEAREAVEAERSIVERGMMITELVTAFLLIGLISLVVRSILSALGRLRECSRRVASGEYDACNQTSFTGELEALRLDIASMVEELKTSMDDARKKGEEAVRESERARTAMLEATKEKEHAAALLQTMRDVAGKAEEISRHLAASTAELSDQASQINTGAERQRRQTEEVATAMEEMNATVLEVAQNASGAAEGAEKARQFAEEGVQRMVNVVAATSEAQDKAIAMKSSLDLLGERAQSIGAIMGVITDIADQTNLLALNAAIEAARAGEAGRGFAVVADEVRKLAEKTMTATGEVQAAIRGIQDGTRVNIGAMDEASRAISTSTELTHAASESLQTIMQIVSDTADRVRSIATAAEEQSAASEEVTRSTEEIRAITADTSESITHTTKEISTLTGLAKNLQEIILRLNAVR